MADTRKENPSGYGRGSSGSATASAPGKMRPCGNRLKVPFAAARSARRRPERSRALWTRVLARPRLRAVRAGIWARLLGRVGERRHADPERGLAGTSAARMGFPPCPGHAGMLARQGHIPACAWRRGSGVQAPASKARCQEQSPKPGDELKKDSCQPTAACRDTAKP